MSADRRWSKFWWEDYEGDPLLSACSLAAQGLWMRMLCLMHRGNPYGHLVINDKQPSSKVLASIVRSTEKELNKLLTELEEHGVFSRLDTGTIFCRRMVKDAEKSEEGREQVQKKWGGNGSSGATRSHRMAEARKKGRHTKEEWEALVEATGRRCVRCGAASTVRGGLVRDHIKPIYQGGSDAIENIQPLCITCNASKGPDNTDHRPDSWRECLGPLEGECLGPLEGECLGQPGADAYGTPTLEARSKKQEARGKKDPPNPPSVGGRSRACRENPDFAVFYANYPRKDAPDDALKAWKALIAAGVNPDEILEGLSRYAFSNNPQYIRLPASWLRGGCWRAVTDNRDPVLVAAGFDFDAIDDDPLASLQRPERLT